MHFILIGVITEEAFAIDRKPQEEPKPKNVFLDVEPRG